MKDMETLVSHLELGFIRGNDIPLDLFFVRKAIRCGEPVESHYYNSVDGATKGGRISTTDICALCFSEDNLVMPEDIEKERDVRGKIPLPTCRLCMNLQVEIPCSAGRKVDYHKKEKQKKKRKEIELQNHVRKKKRKMRK